MFDETLEVGVLVGGPHDGRVVTLDGAVGYHREPAPAPFNLADLTAPEPQPLARAVLYRLQLRYTGEPNRDDEGRLRYCYVGGIS